MYNLDETRQLWVEISLDNLAYNIRQVRKHVKRESLVTAVVKANGYGHGSLEVGKTFLENGADRLAVTMLTEAIELRSGDIKEPILVLGYTPPNHYEKLFKHNLIPTIYNYEEAKILSNKGIELNQRATIHIKIDSGMGRLGFLTNEESIEDIIKISHLPNLNIEGIYTHFARSDEKDKSYTREQFKKYMELIHSLEEKGLVIPIKHASNSAGVMDLPEFNLNMVRPGIILYGLYPSNEVDRDRIKLKPAMTLKARISNVKTLEKGMGISYGHKFITEKESKIATLPLGYGDGFTRMLSSKAEVCINGQRADIVGNICMGQSMVDVSHIQDVKIGDEVIIFGYGKDEYPHVEELAEKLNTINYEIICMVGRRVPRFYLKNNKLVKIVDYLLD